METKNSIFLEKPISPEEAKFARDKHILEQVPSMNKTTAVALAGVTPENYDLLHGIPLPYEVLINTRDIISKYLDTNPQNIEIVSLWLLGTYLHSQFETFPILQLYAQKRSGKTRLLKLLSALAHKSDGSVSTSVTETHLFRHKEGALFFDEMESIGSKERAAFRETLNAVYKRGNKIVRYREGKNEKGEKDFIEQAFYPYYPLGLANIAGLGDVLGDRAIQIILQRSDKNITRLIEDFLTNKDVLEIKEQLSKLKLAIPKNIFSEWNQFILGNSCNVELLTFFKKVESTKIYGRALELFMPLFVIAYYCKDLDSFLETAKNYVSQRQEEEAAEDIDEILKRFVLSRNYEDYVSVKVLLAEFQSTLETVELWQNDKWFGRALKRLGLIAKKRSYNGRSQVLLKNNPTNTTISTNPINTTNTTNNQKEVDLVGFSEFVGQKGNEKAFNPEEAFK